MKHGPPPAAAAKSKPTTFPIAGIGASAGGLEAMSQLLRALPPKPGLALVLVQHLDPTHESALTSLLSRAASMPVLEAKNNLRLEPNHCYVIPPDRLMAIAGRRLRLTPRQEAHKYAPIDYFLISLAREEGSRAIGAILSGSGGSDGTQGLLAIKTAGGITFAQDERSARYPGMPAAAVAADCVDFVLPPNRMARELARLAGHPYTAPAGEEEPPRPADEKAFQDILSTLRRQSGVDFSQYKHATLHRRIQRRAALHKCEGLKDYSEYLRAHGGEARDLFSDILIHVTGFFRDAGVFRTLQRKVLPRLLKNRSAEDPVRIWVPGCSTGEEVYSLAMALLEVLAARKAHQRVQIFGTDINEAALEKGRAGFYPESIQADVPADRLRRFFLKSERGYRINRTVRDICIFARQDVVTDPPFSNLDLVSCRNVIIYLGPALQRKIMPLFHYALKPGGFLLLGASETVGSHADLFALVDKKAKVYAKKATHIRPAVSFGYPALTGRADEAAGPAPADRDATGPSILDIQSQADRLVLSHHSPAGVVINRHLEVLQFRGRTGPYLAHHHGEATLNLLRMAREGLANPLRAAVAHAMKKNARVREEGLPTWQDGQFQKVDVDVVPFQVPPARERFYLVLFETAAPAARTSGEARPGKGPARKGADDAEVVRLREELAATRTSLEAIIEEQEATNEQLRSANEEILSSNEELQSTNEELQTAKEELQSTNEELATLNDELENRNTELERINNDFANVMASVSIPIVMVGPDLRIRRFTAAAEKQLNLIPADTGRPLADINLGISVPELGRLINEVIDTLQTRELDVQDAGRRWWSLHIRPYKTTDNKIDGVVIALMDIDVMKGRMEVASQRFALAEAIVNTVRHPLLVLDSNLMVQSANDAFLRAFRVKAGDTLKRRIYELGEGQWDIPRLRTLLEDILPNNSVLEDFEVEHVFPRIGRRKVILNARRLIGEETRKPLILLAIEDVTDKQ